MTARVGLCLEIVESDEQEDSVQDRQWAAVVTWEALMIIVEKQADGDRVAGIYSRFPVWFSCQYSHGGICWTLAVAAGVEKGVSQG